MEDRELLELAAKAAGIEHVNYDGVDYDGSHGLVIVGEHGQHLHGWNPLTDDGDALRLAIAVGAFSSTEKMIMFHTWIDDARVVIDCESSAFRRAATCYAAEIGKSIT